MPRISVIDLQPSLSCNHQIIRAVGQRFQLARVVQIDRILDAHAVAAIRVVQPRLDGEDVARLQTGIFRMTVGKYGASWTFSPRPCARLWT